MKLHIEIFFTVFVAMIVLFLLIEGFIRICFEDTPLVIMAIVVSAVVATAIVRSEKEVKR